jgi:hypothetical protein
MLNVEEMRNEELKMRNKKGNGTLERHVRSTNRQKNARPETKNLKLKTKNMKPETRNSWNKLKKRTPTQFTLVNSSTS